MPDDLEQRYRAENAALDRVLRRALKKSGLAMPAAAAATPGAPLQILDLACGTCREAGTLVEVFREVRRVLKKEGTCWINLGDSYAGSWGNAGHRPELDAGSSYQREKKTRYFARGGWDQRREVPPNQKVKGCKPKDLIGIPWQLTIGPKGVAEGLVELKRRATGEKVSIPLDEALAKVRG